MKKLDFSDWTVGGSGLLISILGIIALCSGAWWHAITLIGGIAMLYSFYVSMAQEEEMRDEL